jgi:hypothetical protein
MENFREQVLGLTIRFRSFPRKRETKSDQDEVFLCCQALGNSGIGWQLSEDVLPDPRHQSIPHRHMPDDPRNRDVYGNATVELHLERQRKAYLHL